MSAVANGVYALAMHLEMKERCEKCAATLRADGQAYICSYECTFCPECAADARGTCPHCGGELIRRPLRRVSIATPETREAKKPASVQPLLMGGVSFGVWTLVALVVSVSAYQINRSTGMAMSFTRTLGLQLRGILTYAPLTPFAFALALRHPVQRGNWVRRSLLHLAGGLLFTAAHVAFRGIAHYAFGDPQVRDWVSAIGNTQGGFQIQWSGFETLFLSSFIVDVVGVYLPIVLIAHAVAYHQRFRERDLLTSQLEGQLAKSHLQALKSQLQPHFLFNTLHSISALMLTDVVAADRMMSRLSDLLRMSLEGDGTQITTLSRELEFVNGYLEIEKIRFEDRLTVVLDIAADTLDAQVPHLLLQPLVENAVRHGVSRLSSGGEIRIAASHRERSLRLQIRDNGPGLVGPAGGQSKGGLGLGSTRERLRTLYGDDQELDIRNAAEGGVEVNVRIPFFADPRLSVYEVVPSVNQNGPGEETTK